MNRFLVQAILIQSLVLGVCGLHAQEGSKTGNPTARIALAHEFIRELDATYSAQQRATKELASDPTTNQKLMTGIRNSTRIIMDAKSNIGMLSDIDVDGRCGMFVEGLKQINENRVSIHQELIQISTEFLSPKPGVEYGNLLARAPQLTAKNDSLDELLFKLASGIFLCLLDDTRTNSKGNLEYLILARSERAQMRNEIRSIFGANLDAKDQKYIVSAGWIMNQGLSMPKYKAADQISRMGAGPPTPR